MPQERMTMVTDRTTLFLALIIVLVIVGAMLACPNY